MLLLGMPAFRSQYEAAVRQDKPFQQQLVLACLPALECGVRQLDEGAASGIDDEELEGSSVAAALAEHVGADAAAAAAAMLRDGPGWHAVRATVPLLGMPAFAAGLRAVALGPESAQLLDSAAAALRHLVHPASEQQFGGSPERWQTACSALDVAMVAWWHQLEPPGSSHPVPLALAWKLMRLLPDAIASFRLAAAGQANSSGSLGELAASACCHVATLASSVPLERIQPADMSAADVAAWCRAAVAALRVLPLLLQVQPQLRASRAAQRPGAMSLLDILPGRLLDLVLTQLQHVDQCHRRLATTAEGQVEAVRAAAKPLFLLHSVAVRCLHWLCTLDAAQLVATPVLARWDRCVLGVLDIDEWGCGPL